MAKHTLFICEIIFHRAEHVPVSDLDTLSSDPYILASLEVPNVHPDRSDPPLLFRTPTIRRTLNPTYNARWIVGGVSETGFVLTLNLLDEDPGDRDDRLGKVIVHLPDPVSGERLDDGWDTGEVEYKVEKRRGSVKAYLATYLASMITRGDVSHHARIWMSIRVIGKVHNHHDKRIYTVGPSKYTRHFSPLIGHLISSGTAANKTSVTKGKNNKPLGASTFIANRLQLTGPPPLSLRHRYVGYAPFIKSLFKRSGIRGKILNYALHRQFSTIYGYGKGTVYGVAGEGEFDTDGSKSRKMQKTISQNGNAEHGDTNNTAQDLSESNGPFMVNHALSKNTSSEGSCNPDALSRQFLRMASYGTAGRLFTYVITLDSEWRFTETGEEFSVDMLSKHSMHANVEKEIAFSGEFFVRRISDYERKDSPSEEANGDQTDHSEQPDNSEDVSDNLEDYELVIDNDSGTYRPKKELLPTLQQWLERKENLGALGRVTAMDGFDETLKKWKEERRDEKRRAKGLKPRRKKEVVGKEKGENVGDEAAHEGNSENMAIPKKGRSLGSIGSDQLGSRTSSISSSEVEHTLQEDAKRARENKDDDVTAQDEEDREGGKDGGSPDK